MKSGAGEFVQGFNAQIAVDAKHGIIIGGDVSQSAADVHSFMPLIDGIQETFGTLPDEALADAGYRSEDNLSDLAERGVDAYVAMGREGKAERAAAKRKKAPATAAMREKMRTPEGRQRYRKRKHIAESPFGWIKSILGFRGFSLRGLDKVRAEWFLVCTATNLRRMASLNTRGA